MNLRYRIWMQIECFHEFSSNGKCDSFQFIPTEQTAIKMTDLGMRIKQVNSSFLILIKVDENNVPLIMPPQDLRLIFHIDLLDPTFLISANIDSNDLRSKRFYFSNQNDNQAGSSPDVTLHLTSQIESFDGLREYLLGDFCTKSGQIYECIQTGTNQQPDAPSSQFWVDKGGLPFVSSRDMVSFSRALSNFELSSPASLFQVKIYGFNPLSGAFDLLKKEYVSKIPSDAPASNHQVNLSGLSSGLYRVEINGEAFEAWFDDEAVSKNRIGVMEIFNHHPVSHPYSPLDATNVVQEKTYGIRFANRRAFWKYITPLNKVDEILISGNHSDPSPFTSGSNNPSNPAQKDYFISKQPLGLTEKPEINLFDLIVGSETRIAPKPDPRTSGMLTHTFHSASGTYRDSICSIHLNL